MRVRYFDRAVDSEWDAMTSLELLQYLGDNGYDEALENYELEPEDDPIAREFFESARAAYEQYDAMLAKLVNRLEETTGETM